MLGCLNLWIIMAENWGWLGGGRKGVFKKERGKRSSFQSYQKRAKITVTGILFY